MNEPSVDFDLDEVERGLGETQPQGWNNELERAAVERGARAFASLVLLSTTPSFHARYSRAAQARVMIAVYVLRMPGHETLYSLEHIGKLCGMSGQAIRRMAAGVVKKLGLPPGITKTHRRKRNG